jgi:hypothetical protein
VPRQPSRLVVVVAQLVDTALVASPAVLVTDVVMVATILVAVGPRATITTIHCCALHTRSVPKLAMVPKLVGTATTRIPLSNVWLLLLLLVQIMPGTQI